MIAIFIVFLSIVVGSNRAITGTRPDITVMTLEGVAKIAVRVSKAKDTWETEDIMKNVYWKDNEFIEKVMRINLHNFRIIEKRIKASQDMGEDQKESSSEEVEIDENIRSTYDIIMKSKEEVPKRYFIRLNNITDIGYLYEVISDMEYPQLSQFFQACYNIIHNPCFPLILFESIFNTEDLDYYSPSLDTTIRDGDSLFAKAAKNLISWIRKEDLLRRHTQVGIRADTLVLSISSCEAKDIPEILEHLKSKLPPGVTFPNLRLHCVEFTKEDSLFSYIGHELTPYLELIKIDKCTFEDGIFSIAKREVVITEEEKKFLGGVKQLRIVKSRIKDVEVSLRYLTGLRVFNLRDFRFRDGKEPEVIYELVNLRILKLRNGNLTSISNNIKKLTNLELLSLSKNMLGSIPSSVTEIRSLTSLVIIDNGISVITDSISNMKNLTELILDENHLELDRCTRSLDLPNLKTLSLKKCNLSKLPDFVKSLASLVILACSHNKIESLDEELYNSLRGLKKLIASDNRFETIPLIVERMTGLKILIIGTDMSTNPLSIDNFNPPSSLTKLILCNCWFKKEEVPEGVYKLEELTTLSIEGSNIRLVTPGIISLKKITRLKLISCNIVGFPEEVTNLETLNFLHLGCSKGIITIPPSIKNLKSLKNLVMYNCGVTKIPEDLCKLTSLQNINLSCNSISKLPSSIGNLKYLKVLNIHNNKGMIALPDTIGSLLSLTDLNISQCSLTSIPGTIGNLKLLEKLDIGSNKDINKFPSSIGNLYNLKKLRCDNLSLSMPLKYHSNTTGILEKAIPDELFNLYSLERLNLSLNTKLHIIPELIGRLRGLRTLEVSKCGLSMIPDAVYRLPQLEYLNVAVNGISKISEHIKNLKYLKVLKIYCNHLTSVPASLGELYRLKESHLERNRFPNSYSYELYTLERTLRKYSLVVFTIVEEPKPDELPFGSNNQARAYY